jgi:hypothetical protein
MEEIEQKMAESRLRLMALHNAMCLSLIDYYNSYMKFINAPTPNAARSISIHMRRTARMFREMKKEFKIIRPYLALHHNQRRAMLRYKKQKELDKLTISISEKQDMCQKDTADSP